MKNFENLIISASAGTGKTYRLSLEYIALIVRYYEHEGFTLDGILALTFTRKATYEIRERILAHLQSLIQHQDSTLLSDLCKVLGREDGNLDPREEGALISAQQEIICDKRKLQVMTIDSYISAIFRNIVRPLRSIDRYDIDLDAISRRMPYIMSHLMRPNIRSRVDNLLQRRVKPTLDYYETFFADLIEQRWVYYTILYRCKQNVYEFQGGDELARFEVVMQAFMDLMSDCLPPDKEFSSQFNQEFRELMQDKLSDAGSALNALRQITGNPHDAHSLLKVLTKKNIYNAVRVKGPRKEEAEKLQNAAARALADHLYFTLFLSEQREIIELWGIILAEYDRLIYKYKNMTYSDISWFTFEALFSSEPPAFDLSHENTATEFYHFLSHRTRFMLIDEFQDTSLIQFNILKPIIEEISSGYGSKDLGGVIVVGDEKQSIFGWRGGERDLLLNLRYIIPSLRNARTEVLGDSWRSSKDMMTFINSIFSHQGIHSFLASNGMQWRYPMVNSAIGDLNSTIELKCSPYSSNGELDSKRAVFEDFVDKMILPRLNKENSKEKIAIICRKGNQLNLLQLILEEKDKTGVFQPSASIVDHHLVAPLLAWLKFVAYQDAYSLLTFLRSDYLLLGGAALKRVVEELHATNQETADHGKAQSELLKPWFDLASRHLLQSPYRILRELCTILIRDKILKSKRDQLNLQAFMALVKDWELNQATMGSSISDLLDYIEDNRRQETFNQVSIEGEDHIQLLTIHKSKGLQFDRVFVFYDLSEGHRSDYNQLYWSYRYSRHANPDSGTYPGFHDIDAFALSFHYADVLKYSGAKELWEDKQRLALLEELNNLYVAFTRAKSSLHIYFTYKGQKSWGDYFDSKGEDDLKLPAILANACMSFFSGTESDANGIFRYDRSYPETKKEDKQDKKQIIELSLQKSALGCETGNDWTAYQPLSEQLDLDWKAVYLDKRQHLFGDVAHYYLSFIYYDREDEHSFAALQCLNRYGSLLPGKILHATFDRCRRELQKHSYLFDPDYDKVFTELPVDHYRIDRLMINTKVKEALVIDYKTGGIHEEEQVDNYVKSLQKIPAFSGYSFSSKYVKLEI